MNSGASLSTARTSVSTLGPLSRLGAHGGTVLSTVGAVWWGVVKRVRWRSSALGATVVAWVVPLGNSTVGRIRVGPDSWWPGVLVVPEACLEVESWCFLLWESRCVFSNCGVCWLEFLCFVFLVLSVGSHEQQTPTTKTTRVNYINGYYGLSIFSHLVTELFFWHTCSLKFQIVTNSVHFVT